MTFNAGLAVGILDHAAERAPEVARALASEAPDVLCVQEFWLEEHWQMLVKAAGDRLPERIHPEPLSAQDAKPCTSSEIAPVEACINQHCADEGAADLARCAVRHCRHVAPTLSTSCLGCLSRNPMRVASEILADCVDRAGGASASNDALE
ncbi:MAG TPA: endonuclease/exonuclease/phosphatase family protein, partial [Polyangiaceae bacterium]|nr:endonuclease/exonuclease/phosphatase family protein [Polyangiaceae bacterium]